MLGVFSFPWTTALKSQCSELSLPKQVLLQNMNILIDKSSYEKTARITILRGLSSFWEEGVTKLITQNTSGIWTVRLRITWKTWDNHTKENMLYSRFMHRDAEHWKHTCSSPASVRSNCWCRNEILSDSNNHKGLFQVIKKRMLQLRCKSIPPEQCPRHPKTCIPSQLRGWHSDDSIPVKV